MPLLEFTGNSQVRIITRFNGVNAVLNKQQDLEQQRKSLDSEITEKALLREKAKSIEEELRQLAKQKNFDRRFKYCVLEFCHISLVGLETDPKLKASVTANIANLLADMEADDMDNRGL